MNILFTVEFYEPRKGGAEEVVKQIAERLVQKGNTVTVATSYSNKRDFNVHNGVNMEEFYLAGNNVKGIVGTEQEQKRYQQFLIDGKFDVICNYAAQTWHSDLMFDVLDDISARMVIVPVGYSRLYDSLYEEYYNTLPSYLKKYNAIIYHSPLYQDKVFNDAHGLTEKGIIIPNGASKEEFLGSQRINIKKELNITTPFIALSVSNHYRGKGHGFVRRAFFLMRRDDVTLVIVGGRFVSSGWRKWAHFVLDYIPCWIASVLHPNIILVDGDNRERVVALYKESDIFLFGSKVECAPLVMYESFASFTPFITTPVGNVRDHSDVIFIVTTPQEMANQANKLFDDRIGREKVADRAFEIWQHNHTWDIIAEKYESLFQSLV